MRADVVAFTISCPTVIFAVVRDEVTVIVSLLARSVVFPAASFGVIVKVVDSVAATEALVALKVYEAGALARTQSTVVEGSAAVAPEEAPGLEVSVPFAKLSSHTKYLMEARRVGTVSAASTRPVEVDKVSSVAESTTELGAKVDVELSVADVTET